MPAPAKPKDDKAKPDTKAAAKKVEPPKQADAKPKPAKPAAKKRDFNADRIAALLNKIPDAADEAKPVAADDGAPPKKVKGQSSGTEMTMSVNEIDALRARIAKCWSPPPGGLGADQIVIKLRLKLNEDGTLVGYPTIANDGLIALLPGRRRQRRSCRLPVPALRAAEREICAVARHDPQFRPKRHVSQRLERSRITCLHDAELTPSPTRVLARRRSSAMLSAFSRLGCALLAVSAGSRRG